jgi:hypothetical protein
VTALPRRMYRDPAEQLLEAEAQTCKGCEFRRVDQAGIARCKNAARRELLADKRCDEYEEKP